jgi:hypothetical protein
MTSAEREAEPQFSQPVRQIFTMLVVMGLVGTGTWFMMPLVWPVFLSSPYLNGFIAGVFVLGVVAGFWQVLGLISAVSWIEGFAMNRAGHEFVVPPRLLSSLATLLRSRSARMQISASSSKSILDSMATRLDETREITRYLINLLIFLGLLGTFYGLATTVPAVVETIRALAPSEGEAATDVFGRLMTGLEKQLGGMGTAFGSSLLGLAGSLVVGLLELFTGHAQNRFYRELEEWLSTITRVGFSSGDIDPDRQGRGYESDASAIAFHRVAESIEELHKTFIRAEGTQADTAERIAGLTRVMQDLSKKLTAQQGDETARKQADEQTAILTRIAASQERVATLMQAQSEEAVDAESRMRLRSIDVQLLRILEEMSAGRQDTIAELRADLAAVDKSIRGLSRRPPQVPNLRDRG